MGNQLSKFAAFKIDSKKGKTFHVGGSAVCTDACCGTCKAFEAAWHGCCVECSQLCQGVPHSA